MDKVTIKEEIPDSTELSKANLKKTKHVNYM